ncbi:NGFI-A-binding protein 1-like isoform X1 [Styela clava]
MSTTKPSTLGELQLFKVLQRANLLSYYETFISQGGDDVQQLCEAGEEEFLEIMALVGMACKPLHVRRLQKALQEWVTRPAMFRGTSINYLPAQSIPLTSLGIDARDLAGMSITIPNKATSPGFARETNGALPGQDELSNRPLSVGGSAMTSPKSMNGFGNVFRIDNNSRKVNGTGDIDDAEMSDAGTLSTILNHAVHKYIKSATISSSEKKDLLSQLKEDRSCRDLAHAIENHNKPRMEVLIREYIKGTRTSDNMSEHEILVTDAAVKLCLADNRFLIKKNELIAIAEKVAVEVEKKAPSRRRSSTHLHGSCSQSRIQEVNDRLQNIKSQRSNLHKTISDAQNNKNVIKENDCQNILAKLAKEEILLLQEKNELSEKLQNENRERSSSSVQMESTTFSSELADLAKAHNISFGNLQSLPNSSTQWSRPNSSSDSSSQNSVNGDKNYDVTGIEKPTPSQSSGLSPPRIVSIDFKGSTSESERRPPELIRIKTETESENEFEGLSTKSNVSSRTNKRKHTAEASNGSSVSKKSTSSTITVANLSE